MNNWLFVCGAAMMAGCWMAVDGPAAAGVVFGGLLVVTAILRHMRGIGR